MKRKEIPGLHLDLDSTPARNLLTQIRVHKLATKLLRQTAFLLRNDGMSARQDAIRSFRQVREFAIERRVGFSVPKTGPKILLSAVCDS